ncbi:MAG: phosphatase PAP2 family protein [Desulfarculaceae bacterium]|nr:phosphatase PAP2 family protein [Desulfarculaceae bacterium]
MLRTTGLCGLGVAALIAMLFWLVDRPVDLACRDLAGGGLHQAATYLSLLADHDFFNVWLFCGLVLGGVLALGRGLTPGVRGLLYVCLAVAATMLIGETLKWFFGRHRPVMLFEKGLYGFSWFATKGWGHSFPSGHNFRIFAALTALGMLWPKARWPLLTLAVLVGVSRVIVTRHYPSDIVAGAFLGIVGAVWAWRIGQAWWAGQQAGE